MMKSVLKQVRSIVIMLFAALVAVCFLRLYAGKFYVGGNSMEPSLYAGERLWVDRLTGRLSPGDIAVFHSPEGAGREVIRSRRNYVYTKRCIGVPGDTVGIKNGFYYNASLPGRLLMPPDGQALLSLTPDSLLAERGVWMPALPATGWSIRDFGPMLVPRAGCSLRLDSLTCRVYAKAIEFESGRWPLPGEEYTFTSDWYFFGGDNVQNSRDSRYIGLIPKSFVVGRVVWPRRNAVLRKKDRALEKALVYAGDNRGALEAVLYHYRGDKRKLRAAEWLVRNMPGHYGYAPFEGLDSVKAVLADLKAGKNVPMERIHRWQDVDMRGYQKKYDSKVITSSFLISNIDQAFEALDVRPWNRNLSENDFYELILPYRVGDEPLGIDWRRLYQQRYAWVLDSLYTGKDVVGAIDAIHSQIEGDYFQYNTYFQPPSLGPDFLMNTRIGVCKEICEFTLYVMRALGIPVATDNNAMRSVHSWNTVSDTTGKYELFWMDQYKGTRISRGGDDGRIKGKVYRSTFARPYKKDVSADYFGRSRLLVPFKGKTPVWMALFSQSEWFPAERVKSIGSLAVFSDVEPGLAFIPMAGGKVAGYPVALEARGGKSLRFVPDHRHLTEVKVSRKTRLRERIVRMMSESIGVTFDVADNPDIHCSRTIGICKAPQGNYNYISVSDTIPFRFLRISPQPGSVLQMAEVRLFADMQCRDTVRACRILGPEESYLMTDDDELSYYLAGNEDTPVILDLGKPQRVSVIEWVPRNDDNFIRHGDKYELLYQDGRHGWKCVGTQVASDTILVFTGVPSGALLRLHDLTRGKEEEVFTISVYGEQVFR